MRYAHRAPLTRGQVRCCSDATDEKAPAHTGSANNTGSPWIKKDGCSVWGGSDEGWECAGKDGNNQKTFAEAEAICKAAGARLCTVDELKCTVGTGCGLDVQLVWASAPPVG